LLQSLKKKLRPENGFFGAMGGFSWYSFKLSGILSVIFVFNIRQLKS
jgi:hypothetical protein